MQRARRLASTAVVAVLAVSGLSACRAESDVAAYVGRTTITEARVDEVFEDAERKVAAAVGQVRAGQGENPDPSAAAPGGVQLQIRRKDVLEALLGVDVLGTLAKQRNITPGELNPAQVAQSLNLPADAAYVGIQAQYRAYLSAFAAGAKPVTASPAELREVYDRFKAAGGFQQNAVPAFEEFSSTLSPEDRQTLEQSMGLREQLKGDVAKLNVTVNPRYGVRELPLLPITIPQKGSTTLVGVPLAGGSGDPVVVDVS
jgi:hypothetical protein